jgi:hypothetical protein
MIFADWHCLSRELRSSNVISNAVLGGLASVAGGGKFANGAVTGAFGYLFSPQAGDQGAYASCGTDPKNCYPDPMSGVDLNDPQEVNGALKVGLASPLAYLLMPVLSLVPELFAADAAFDLLPPLGAKSSQVYARWLAAGNTGSFADFMASMNGLAASATEAGTAVTGQVGQVGTGLADATIFRSGMDFLVVQGNRIMSYVPNANSAVGIVKEYLKLGGSP